jgi:hypothetical protein
MSENNLINMSERRKELGKETQKRCKGSLFYCGGRW